MGKESKFSSTNNQKNDEKYNKIDRKLVSKQRYTSHFSHNSCKSSIGKSSGEDNKPKKIQNPIILSKNRHKTDNFRNIGNPCVGGIELDKAVLMTPQ